MRRKLGLLTALLLVIGVCGGCSFFESRVEMLNSWYRDLRHINESVDRHLLNYDWEDPYL